MEMPAHITKAEQRLLRARGVFARMMIDLTMLIHEQWFGENASLVRTADLILILNAVVAAHADGSLATANKIALQLRMPHQSVARKLEYLEQLDLIERRGREYAFKIKLGDRSRAKTVAAARRVINRSCEQLTKHKSLL
jgi:hypothetical protein